MRKIVSLLSVAGFVALAGCGEQDVDEESLDSRVLHGFDDCEQMLAFTSSHTLELLEGDAYGGWGGDFGGVLESDDAAAGDGNGGGDISHSTTNVQEAGVDEPDLVKTDGERILAIAQNRLHLVDASEMVPELRGSLALPAGSWDPQLFLAGDRALVLVRTDNHTAELVDAPEVWGEPNSWVPLTQLIEVDLSNPDELEIIRTQSIGGDYVAARMVDDTVRVVIRSSGVGLDLRSAWEFIEEGGGSSEPGHPGEEIPEEIPDDEGEAAQEGDGGAEFRMGGSMQLARKRARAHNKQVLASATAENFLPQYLVDDGESVESGLLYGCENAMRPGDASGMDVLSVVTIQLDGGLQPAAGVGVFSSGETVYASKEGLYVATHPWFDWAGGGGVAIGGDVTEPAQQFGEGGMAFRSEDSDSGITSYIHKFDISEPTRADYVASGSVRGWLMDQWSMSEHEGILRVASTDQGSGLQESFVTTLEHRDDELEQLGQVGGLGEGESVYAVRFMGDTGYVVTFRQIDPLYTLDVSDPAAPVVLGELKIAGYSSYLHPIGEHHLIGIGQDATEEGQVLGTQLSIFDVGDLNNPVRVHQMTLGEGWSEAEYDHHAFMYWQPENLVVLPISAWNEADDEYFMGAMALRVDVEEGIEHIVNLQHGEQAQSWDEQTMPRRSVVIEDRLFTVSEQGLLTNALGDFSELGWTEFAG
jgi:hypothetical protein